MHLYIDGATTPLPINKVTIKEHRKKETIKEIAALKREELAGRQQLCKVKDKKKKAQLSGKKGPNFLRLGYRSTKCFSICVRFLVQFAQESREVIAVFRA